MSDVILVQQQPDGTFLEFGTNRKLSIKFCSCLSEGSTFESAIWDADRYCLKCGGNGTVIRTVLNEPDNTETSAV
jgi:hypothetical protein